MKKLLSTIVSIVLAFTLLALTACNSTNTFDGTYTTMSQEDVTALRTDLASSNVKFDTNNLTNGKGYKISLDYRTKTISDSQSYQKVSVNSNHELIKQNDKLVAKSELNLNNDTSTGLIDGMVNFYHDGETLFCKCSYKGTNETVIIDFTGKETMPINSFLNPVFYTRCPIKIDLSEILSTLDKSQGVTVSKNDSDDNVKIKVEFDTQTFIDAIGSKYSITSTTNMTFNNCYFIFVYAKTTKTLIGYKQVMDITLNNGGYYYIATTIESTTDSITVPDEYKSFSDEPSLLRTVGLI